MNTIDNKCCIITINDPQNYGNRLQNYALLEVLKRYFTSVETAHVYLSHDLIYGPFVARLKHSLSPIKRALIGVIQSRAGLTKVASFESFTRKYVPETQELFAGDISANETTIYVLGSDQIWNYRFHLNQQDLETRLGEFVSEKHVISYAASIGLDLIEEDWRPIFKLGWTRLSHISVREDRAVELVRDISGRNATVVLDPTLLLSAEKWSNVFTGFVPEDDRYVLTYFLGSPIESQEKIIQACADSIGVRVRRINDPQDRKTYAAGPAEFVELFSRAECVFTDSYHACCFSVLFNKPFKVFNRSGFEGVESMNSRMRTLFRLFELEDLMGDDSAMPEFNWNRINELLQSRRAESLSWLESALADVTSTTVA